MKRPREKDGIKFTMNVNGSLQAKFFLVFIWLACTLFIFSCNGNTTDAETVTRPEGWETESHSKKADPDYNMVFDGDSVKRIDITFSAENWQAMQDKMVELYGEQNGGTGQMPDNPNGEIPGDWSNMDGGGTFPDPPDDGGGWGGNDSPPDTDGGQDILDQFPDENPDWATCTLNFEDKTWNFVGFRFKGNSSLSASWQLGTNKLPFRLDFDKFEDDYPEIDDQRFYGFDKLSMSSNYSDDSFLREKVVADIYRDAGVPAPRTAFYRIFIDIGDDEGLKYFGLYTMVEIPAKPMLESQFSDNGGNLYKPEGDGATFSEYDETGEDYDKETNEDEADFSDVKALYDYLNAERDDAETWRANLESVFDVDGFLRWLAVNTVIVNWDTYGQMSHNYYLYNDPEDNLLHWIPWDNNMAMMDQSGGQAGGMGGAFSLYLTEDEVSEKWPLIRYLIDDPIYWEKYVGHVRETVETVFYPERMEDIFNDAHDLITPYVVGEEGEQEGYTLLTDEEAFETALTELINHVSTRYEIAESFLAEEEN